MQSTGPLSNIEYLTRMHAQEFPDVCAAYTKQTGHVLTPAKMSDIAYSVTPNYQDEYVSCEFSFKYEPNWIAVMWFTFMPGTPPSIRVVESMIVTNTLTGESRTTQFADGEYPPDPFVWSANEEEVFKMPNSAPMPRTSQRKPRIPRQPVERHDIRYDAKLTRIVCSCLENPHHTWCPVIMKYVEQATDVNIVAGIIEKLRLQKKGDDTLVVNLPVMPRTVLPIKIERALVVEPEEGTERLYDYRFTAHDDVKIWWTPGEGFRALVTEMFAYLHASKKLGEWRSAVAMGASIIRGGSWPSPGIASVCNHKYHSVERSKLLFNMVDERLDGDNPNRENADLQYLAMLNAFHDVIYGKCYACHVSFNPANDVPRI